MSTAGTTFVRALGANRSDLGPNAVASSIEAVGALIEDAHAEARAHWSPVELDLHRYAEHLATAVAAAGAEDPMAALASLHLLDLYLAYAAGTGQPAAQELFVRRFLDPIAAAVAAIDSSPGLVDDVRQALNERLLLTPGHAPPRILQYGGRAALSSWVGVAARREALGLLRDGETHRRAAERAAEERLPITLDPELEFLKTRYRAAFKAAVSSAIARLPPRERTVIRLRTVGGLSLARIAGMMDVDESTVSRWEKRARDTISAQTHHELGNQLGVQVGELPSLARLVTSQLDVSVARLLAEGEAGTPARSELDDGVAGK